MKLRLTLVGPITGSSESFATSLFLTARYSKDLSSADNRASTDTETMSIATLSNISEEPPQCYEQRQPASSHATSLLQRIGAPGRAYRPTRSPAFSGPNASNLPAAHTPPPSYVSVEPQLSSTTGTVYSRARDSCARQSMVK